MLQKIQDRGINYIHFIFPFLPKYHIISNKSFSTISSLCQSINYQWTPKAPFVISVTKWKSGVIWFSRTLKTHLCLLILFPSQTLLFNTFQSLHYQTSGFPLLRQKALVSILASFFFKPITLIIITFPTECFHPLEIHSHLLLWRDDWQPAGVWYQKRSPQW